MPKYEFVLEYSGDLISVNDAEIRENKYAKQMQCVLCIILLGKTENIFGMCIYFEVNLHKILTVLKLYMFDNF